MQFQAKATISLRTIEQIKTVEFKWPNGATVGFMAQTVSTGSYNTAFGYNAAFVPNNNIQFNTGKTTDPVLTITAEGDVKWNGKPSEAASKYSYNTPLGFCENSDDLLKLYPTFTKNTLTVLDNTATITKRFCYFHKEFFPYIGKTFEEYGITKQKRN